MMRARSGRWQWREAFAPSHRESGPARIPFRGEVTYATQDGKRMSRRRLNMSARTKKRGLGWISRRHPPSGRRYHAGAGRRASADIEIITT